MTVYNDKFLLPTLYKMGSVTTKKCRKIQYGDFTF